MSKTAKKVATNGAVKTGRIAEQAAMNPAVSFGLQATMNKDLSLAAIMNTMRVLKRVNPGDAYYEAYLGMIARYGDDFFDTYQVLWTIGIHRKPKSILEIGTRTGISLCQLLSAHGAIDKIEKIICVDPFDQWTSANLVRANLAYLNLPSTPDKVEILAMKSEDYFKAMGGPEVSYKFDYILVDGDHAKPAAAADLESAHTLLASGGIMVFDDISTAPGECALADVWEAFVNNHVDEYYFNASLSGKGVAWSIKK